MRKSVKQRLRAREARDKVKNMAGEEMVVRVHHHSGCFK